MGITYKSPRLTRPGQSVCIATPAYDSIKPGYAFSLALTTAELTAKGIPFELLIMHGNCHVDDGRNSLVTDFLHDTQCTDLVFIDSDLKWDAKTFLQLIKHDTVDIVAGAYPLKSFPKKFPIGKILNAHPDGLLEVSYAPTGFMRIPRTVFEKLIPSQTKRGKEKPTYRFFERRYTERTYDGGDVTFCRKWIAAGGKVIVDPRLVLDHIGEYRWSGCFLDYLAKDENRELHTVNSKDPVPEYKPDQPQEKQVVIPKASPVGKPPSIYDPAFFVLVEALATDPEIKHFQALADLWGNKPWAATAEYCEMAYKMVANLKPGQVVLECGSGLSTIVIAIAARRFGVLHTVLEHTDEWQDRVLKWFGSINLTAQFPKVNYDRETQWYDFSGAKPDLIIIDGPPRYLGADRLYPLKQEWIGSSGVLIDDASSKILEQLKSISGQWVPMVLGGRPCAAGRAGETNDNRE